MYTSGQYLHYRAYDTFVRRGGLTIWPQYVLIDPRTHINSSDSLPPIAEETPSVKPLSSIQLFRRDAAEAILRVVPASIQPRLALIDTYVRKMSGSRTDSRLHLPQLSRFSLPDNYSWTPAARDGVAELDALYNDGSFRRDLLTGVSDALCSVSLHALNYSPKAGYKAESISKSDFGVSPQRYAVSVAACDRLARNQLIGSFRKNDGTKVEISELARKIKMAARVVEPGLLEITDDKGRSTSYNTDHKLYSYSSLLPTAHMTLNQLYKAALSERGEECEAVK